MIAMWVDQSVFYHIYPLGFCGAEPENDFYAKPRPRLSKLLDWLPHLQSLGVNALYLGPIFESSSHGYDTADYSLVDRRLGTKQLLKEIVSAYHAAGIRIVLDGVFNHVGRGFHAFEEVRRCGRSSLYCSWFRKLSFDRDNRYHDGFCYEGWDGCDNLVKLNLRNPQVVEHLLAAVTYWIKEFDIDGIRLDVAHYLPSPFLSELHRTCRRLKEDFWLMGEACFGDYRRLVAPGKLDSVTNYECYKGLHSSCNENNMYEIAYSLNRQFGEGSGLYRGLNLYSFLDNHDVSRIAEIIKDSRQLKPLYTLMFAMPGIPSLYYGSEWGAKGCRQRSDAEVRPCLELQADVDLTLHLKYLINLRKNTPALAYGSYHEEVLNNQLLVFSRTFQNQTVLAAINIGADYQQFKFKEESYSLPPFSSEIYRFT